MALHLNDNGTVGISARGTRLPGVYADARTARFAFLVDDLDKETLHQRAIRRGDGIIQHADIAELRAHERFTNRSFCDSQGCY